MKTIIAILFFASATTTYAQYGWQKVDTVTTGDFDDYNPQIDHGGHIYSYQVMNDWVIFERWNSGASSIAAARYLGQQLRWDSIVYTISPDLSGITQGLPDICTVSGEVLVDSVYVSESFTVAAWEEKADSVWNIYYSTCDPDSSNWSAPTPLTHDVVSNENPAVRVLTDTSLIIIWKRNSTICYSIVGMNSVSSPKELVASNTDSVEFDFSFYNSAASLVWTQKGADGNRYCLISNIPGPDSMNVSVSDSILLDGDIQAPRFIVSFSPAFAFDLRDGGRYEAWMASYEGYPGTWQSGLIAGDTASDNLHLAFYVPEELTTASEKALDKITQIPLYGFSVWERQTGSDTSLIFSNPDTITTFGYNRNPSISSSDYLYNYGQKIGFAVFESSRTGRSHIYARYFIYSLGAVDEKPPSAAGFSLYQNYPNPFNPTTTITYQLSKPGNVTLKVYDVLGRLVKTLLKGRQIPGEHSVVFDASRLSSGVYFYRVTAGSMASTRKMVLLK